MSKPSDNQGSPDQSASGRVLFVASKALGLSVIEAALTSHNDLEVRAVTLDDSADSRSQLPGFGLLANRYGFDLKVVSHPSGLRGPIEGFNPDLVVVAGWYWLISNELLSKVPGGFVGIHASLLPRFRGNAPLVWAILGQEPRTGVTLFHLDQGMDTGDVVDQIAFDIGHDDSIGVLLGRATEAAVALIERHLGALVGGSAPRIPQDNDAASYCSLRSPQDGLIDWIGSSSVVHNFVRAQSRPYPGAFAKLGEDVVRIWAVAKFPRPYFGIPGLVCQFLEGAPVVATGDGAVVLVDYEVETSGRPDIRYGDRLS